MPVHVAYKDEKLAMALWENSIDIRYRVWTEEAYGNAYGENYLLQNRRAVGTLHCENERMYRGGRGVDT